MKSKILRYFWVSLVVLALSLLPAQAQTIRAESIASETTPDSQLESALYREFPDAGTAEYQYNRVDLNDDGEAEVLVFLSSSTLCGSGGCQIMVMQRSGQDYRKIADLFGLALPIIVSDQTTNGWHDLVAHGSSLFNQEDYFRLRFDGSTYSSEPLPRNATIAGRGFLSGAYFNEGIQVLLAQNQSPQQSQTPSTQRPTQSSSGTQLSQRESPNTSDSPLTSEVSLDQNQSSQINLTGTWIRTGTSFTVNWRGCTAGYSGRVTVNGSEATEGVEFTVTQRGNQLIFPTESVTWSNGGSGSYTFSAQGTVSGNGVSVLYSGSLSGGFTQDFTGTISNDGNTVTGEIFCRASGGAATARGTVTWTRQQICQDAISSNTQRGLDRWWATAGEDESIDVTWTIEVPVEGEYELSVILEGFHNWKLQSEQGEDATVKVNSGNSESFEEFALETYRAKLGCLKAGVHKLTIDGFQVPEEPTIEQIKFNLSGTEHLDLTTLFIADRPEVDGFDVSAYAPILYFDDGSLQDGRKEEYPHLYDAAASWNQSQSSMVNGDATEELLSLTGALELELLSRTSRDAAYATVARNERGETAISYYFHYPNSNWRVFGGQNNHEGDWEGITLFLDSEGDPNRVAYSQHVSVSDAGWVYDQADGGIVVPWEYVEHESNRVKVYVGLGGHASYPFPGITDWTIPELRPGYSGLELHKGDLNEEVRADIKLLHRVGSLSLEHEDAWLLFPGQWGTDEDSPRGPMFLDVSKDVQSTNSGLGQRWLDPWSWSENFETSALKIREEGDFLSESNPNDILIGGNSDDTLLGGIRGPYLLKGGEGNDTYIVTVSGDSSVDSRTGGIFIQDRNGTDNLVLNGMAYENQDEVYIPKITLFLSAPRSGITGLAKVGNSLIIDLNQNGVAELVENNYETLADLAILDFFGNGEGGRGEGFIETVGNLVGTEILQNLGG